MSAEQPIVIATRGSALALAQANMVLAQCRTAFPKLSFELKIVKTTGDKLQTASLAKEGTELPTDLPAGLRLGAVGERADVRDVLIYRDAAYLEAAEANRDSTEWTPGQAKRRG